METCRSSRRRGVRFCLDLLLSTKGSGGRCYEKRSGLHKNTEPQGLGARNEPCNMVASYAWKCHFRSATTPHSRRLSL